METWIGWMLPSQFKDHFGLHCLFSLRCNKTEVLIGRQEDESRHWRNITNWQKNIILVKPPDMRLPASRLRITGVCIWNAFILENKRSNSCKRSSCLFVGRQRWNQLYGTSCSLHHDDQHQTNEKQHLPEPSAGQNTEATIKQEELRSERGECFLN